MSPHLRRAPAAKLPPHASTTLERDASNFDFRVVTLLMVLATRQDLLKEYLEDGSKKDAIGVPSALHDPTKWKTLRTLFDAPMLAEMLYLFELPKTQDAARHFLTVFRTMTQFEAYHFDGCPNPDFVRNVVSYAGQQTSPLEPAGVAADLT